MHDRLHIVVMSLATVYVFVLGVVMTSERQRDSRKLYRTYADPAPVHPALLAVTPWTKFLTHDKFLDLARFIAELGKPFHASKTLQSFELTRFLLRLSLEELGHVSLVDA